MADGRGSKPGHRTPIVVEYDDDRIEWFGRRAQIALKSDSYMATGGRYKGIYVPKPYMDKLDGCEHKVTICETCIEHWRWDYAVLLFPYHGDAGYNQGCRCETCIMGRIKWLPESQLDKAKRINIRSKMLEADPELDCDKFWIQHVCDACVAAWPEWCPRHKPADAEAAS